jgi:hypothetical protein
MAIRSCEKGIPVIPMKPKVQISAITSETIPNSRSIGSR